METSQLVLEYCRLLLSAPFLAAVVAVVFFLRFRPEISALIDRVAEGEIAGPFGLKGRFVSQEEKTKQEETPHEEAPKPPPQVELPKEVTLTPEMAERVRQMLQSARAEALLWHYRYLNFYLARSTQVVLDWFSTLPHPIDQRFFDSVWQAPIPDTNERLAVLNALRSHKLVVSIGPLLEVTPEGRQYLQWRGPLPPLPPSRSA